MICCFLEHIFSYACAFYRKNDIYKNGKYDINGIKRAVNESKLGSIQFFIVCIIIGFTVNFFLDADTIEEFHDQKHSVQNYWIVIDTIVMFLSQTYISTSLYMRIEGEINKNLYTLY